MKNILIVGAGKGIGLSTVQTLKSSYNLYTVSRNQTTELNNLDTTFFEIDTATNNLEIVNNLPDEIHGLVYCPGSINLKPFNRLSSQDFLNDFQQNVLGAINVIQKILPKLKNAHGASIVLFSSVAVKLGMPFHASVAASKGAIEGLAKSLAAELAGAKITVNVIAPSLTDTPLATMLLNTTEKRESSNKRHPLQRIGNAHEISKLVEFLLSENASWMTGQIIGIDGGMGSLKV